jgi:hypothetical protein
MLSAERLNGEKLEIDRDAPAPARIIVAAHRAGRRNVPKRDLGAAMMNR